MEKRLLNGCLSYCSGAAAQLVHYHVISKLLSPPCKIHVVYVQQVTTRLGHDFSSDGIINSERDNEDVICCIPSRSLMR